MAVSVVYAQQPPQNSKSATAAVPASTASAAQANPAAKKAAAGKSGPTRNAAAPATSQEPADPSRQLLRDARNAGFRPQNIRGSLMFCRVAIELVSNFPVRTCYNEQQVKIQEYQAQRNQLEEQHSIAPGCRPPTC